MDFRTNRMCLDDFSDEIDVSLLEDLSISDFDEAPRSNPVKITQKVKKWSTLSLKNKTSEMEDFEKPITQKPTTKRTSMDISFKTPNKSPAYKKLKTVTITRTSNTTQKKFSSRSTIKNNTAIPSTSTKIETDGFNIKAGSLKCAEEKKSNLQEDISHIQWLEDTQTFMSNMGKENTKKEAKVELDSINTEDFFVSFAEPNVPKSSNMHYDTHFLNELKENFSQDIFAASIDPKGSTKLADSQFSQFSNSQLLKECAKIEDSFNQSKNDLVDESKILRVTNQILSPNQILSNTSEKLWNETLADADGLFQNDDDYRRDVNLIFNKLESTICDFGNKETDESTWHDDSLSKNSFLSKLTNLIKDPQNESVKCNDDNTFSSMLLNLTGENEINLTNIIKKALMNNAKKVVEPANYLNPTCVDSQHEFKHLGNFFGLPNKVKDLMKLYKGIDKLYDWQIECLSLPAIASRQNLIYALPTSGGKTLVAEILMLREVLCRNRNVIFVLPYVSIVQEKIWALSPFAVALDFLIEEYAGGKGTYPPRKRRRKNSIYIATIEKALGLVNSLIETNRIQELGLVVVDELHLIGDQSRGATLEALLTKLIFVKKSVQIVGMSATIGNLEEICSFLRATLYSQNFRPVELIEYVKCGDSIFKINWQAQDEMDLLVLDRKVTFPYSEAFKQLDPDHLAGLVLEVIPQESCLIFCSSKKSCENVALLLCKVLIPKIKEHKKHEKMELLNALKSENINLCHILDAGIPFGVAYHHSGLTMEERKLIEDAFRAGIISVICCTSTLAAGVNLPAKRVILRQPYIGRDFINLSRYKQMVGRAGRTGFGEKGESILICKPQELPQLRKMLLAPMDLAESSMQEYDYKGLRLLILSCINLNLGNTRSELQTIIRHTLMAVQQKSLKINVKKVMDEVIVDLFKLGALENPDAKSDSGSSISGFSVNVNTSADSFVVDERTTEKSKVRIILTNDTRICISKLGSAAIKAGLDLNRAHTLYDDLCQAQTSLVLVDCLHLLYLVTPYDLSEQITPNRSHYYDIYSQLNPKELQTARIIGLTEACAVKLMTNQPIKNVSERVLNRFYVTLMLYDLWNEISVYQVSEKFRVNRGHIQNLMIGAATFASNVVNFCEELDNFWAFAHLLRGMSQRLSHCCVRELVPLMELPAVKQNRARQLFNAGYKTLQSVAKADVNDLIQKIEFMSRKVANQLVSAAKMLLLEKVENLREEAEDVLDGIDQKPSY